MKYKILISDKNYQNYYFVNMENNDDVILEKIVDPIKEKMFSKDIFSLENENVLLHYSHVRSGITIAGILMLENNKTFGRTLNKKRLLYKCIPDDKHLPAFLVPYDIKIGFSKIQKNKYVTFKFDSWNFTHPQGILLEVLGDVGDPTIFYEYQLYCKNLHISLTNFTNKTKDLFLKKTNDEYIQQILKNPDFNIQDRRDQTVFSIDPSNSLDFDDAFGIVEKDDGSYIISIYIANVYLWLEVLNLWKSFSSRVSTIYLPDRKRPMLPTILSDNLCSLQENQTRFAFTMDIFLDKDYHILRSEYRNTAIKVSKNYKYEESELLYNCPQYDKLLEITMKQDSKTINSHDVVSFWMVYMNKSCGLWMMENEIGIFRSVYYKNKFIFESLESNVELDVLPLETQRVIKTWNNTAGLYVVYNKNAVLEHEIMKMKCYIHITSPIRRIVDLLNQIWIMKSMKLIVKQSDDCDYFFDHWVYKIDYINESMRIIRKIQTDCELVHRFFNEIHSENINIPTVYEGTVFGKVVKNDGSIHYMVFIESIQLLSRINTHIRVENYSKQSFRLFFFEDEHKVKKIIRLQILCNSS